MRYGSGPIDRQHLLNELRKLYQNWESVDFAYLFGSRSTGRENDLSDIDVAVYVSQKVEDTLKLRLHLMRDVQSALHIERVDVVLLNEVPLGLRYVVQRDGILIGERDRTERIEFETKTRKEFWDFQPRLKVYAEFMLKRLREARFGT